MVTALAPGTDKAQSYAMNNIETSTTRARGQGIQHRQVRRHRLILAFFLVAIPLAIASTAFACQSLATLHANPSTTSASVQTTLSITGNGFDPGGSEVQIRLDTLSARETLATVQTAELNFGGGFTVLVVIPGNLKVGYHFLAASQSDVNGRLTAGTPVRASFQVLPASASPSAVPFGPGHPHEAGHPNITRSSVMGLVMLAPPLGIAPLAASAAIGLVLSRRRRRTP